LVFFSLASYLWTACFAFHLYRILGRRCKYPELYEHRYHLLAWGIPATVGHTQWFRFAIKRLTVCVCPDLVPARRGAAQWVCADRRERPSVVLVPLVEPLRLVRGGLPRAALSVLRARAARVSPQSRHLHCAALSTGLFGSLPLPCYAVRRSSKRNCVLLCYRTT
jgi:hypothetical protein